MRLRVIKLIKLELRDAYRFPLFECIFAILSLLLLPISTTGERGSSLSFIRDFGVDPVLFRILSHNVSIFLEYIFALQILVIPIIIGFRVSQSIENGEVETLLTLPISRFEILSAKLLTHLISNLILFIGLFVLWEYLKLPTLFFREDLVSLFIIMFVQLIHVISLPLLVSLIFRRAIISTILSVVLWYILRFGRELGWIVKPYYYMFPFYLTKLLYVLLPYYIKGFPYPDPIELLNEPLAEVPVVPILFGSMMIVIVELLASYLLFCKLIEFKR